MIQSAIPPMPVWLSWALLELQKGVAERPGREHHPRILEYHRHTTLRATEDEVSWCSSAMNCCMAECGLKGTGAANARSWLGWGIPLSTFRPGAIAVFWRVSRESWQGHVFIALWEDGEWVWGIGGNQDNKFSIAKYPKHQLLGYRWPTTIDIVATA